MIFSEFLGLSVIYGKAALEVLTRWKLKLEFFTIGEFTCLQNSSALNRVNFLWQKLAQLKKQYVKLRIRPRKIKHMFGVDFHLLHNVF